MGEFGGVRGVSHRVFSYDDGYKIPKEDLLALYNTPAMKGNLQHALDALLKEAIKHYPKRYEEKEYQHEIPVNYPDANDIIDMIKSGELEYIISSEALKHQDSYVRNWDHENEKWRKSSEGVGGEYIHSRSVVYDEEAQESYQPPDQIFIKEPYVQYDQDRGRDQWAMEDALYPDGGRIGFAETMLHEPLHAMRGEGHDQLTHNEWMGVDQKGFKDVITKYLLPYFEGPSAERQALEDIYYDYKEWKLRTGDNTGESVIENYPKPRPVPVPRK